MSGQYIAIIIALSQRLIAAKTLSRCFMYVEFKDYTFYGTTFFVFNFETFVQFNRKCIFIAVSAF